MWIAKLHVFGSFRSGSSFKFVTTLANLRGELGFCIVGYVLTRCHLPGLLKQRGDRPWSRRGARSI
jgi:hypothetical protein